MLGVLLDISIQPSLQGIPPSVIKGLIQLGDNLAAVLLIIAGIGIVLSLIGMVAGSWLRQPYLAERSRSGLMVAASAGGLLFAAVAIANYATRLFA